MGAATLIAGRLLQYAGASLVFGSALFFLYGTRAPAHAGDAERWTWQRVLLLGGALTGLVGALVWLMAETAALSGDAADAIDAAALWSIASETRFGLACSTRLALLLLAVSVCFLVGRPRALCWAQVILGSAITMSFAWTGHGATGIGTSGGVHLAADLLHLLAAGIWTGALVPLAVLAFRAARSADVRESRQLSSGLQGFSAVGVWIVGVLAFSGILNSAFLLDLSHWRDALHYPYGRVLAVKLLLFAAMLGFAALHRYRTTSLLETAMPRAVLPMIPARAACSSLLLETVLAALVLGAVSILGTLAPPDAGNN